MEPEQPSERHTLTVPLAIVVAGLLISGAIFFSRGGTLAPEASEAKKEQGAAAVTAKTSARPVDARDHIRGNPDADVIIIEYSDTECPFCKRFHETMKQMIDEYGKGGRVAWVYRQFPLVELHRKAPKESEATECAAELGGNAAFWNYLDELFAVTPSNDGLPPEELPAIAERVGLDRAAFEECLSSGRQRERVESDYRDAVASGGRGTPWSIARAKNGKEVPINGAESYALVKQTIDELLK